jgi:putative Holliday junction resolvase
MPAAPDDFLLAAAAFGPRGALLGLDPGEKTIGVALCDPDRRVATPLETIRRAKFAADAARLSTLAAERAVVGLVIGLPRNMNGSEGPRAQAARAFAHNLARILPLPAAFWDERLSTAAVERDLIALDMSRARRAEKIDQSAAAFILQGAIDRLANARALQAP